MDDIPRGLEKEYKLLAKWIFFDIKNLLFNFIPLHQSCLKT